MIKKILRKINSIFFNFKPKFYSEKNLTHVGTIYGGYDVFVEELNSPNIISCGLGEDATFDIEMINRFNANVISIDPTPRALKHFNEIKFNFGKKRTTTANETGKLAISDYNLEKVSEKNFNFINKAIWKENNKEIKLFFPKNEANVSLSINKNPKFSEEYYLAQTINYQEILNTYKLKKIDILKLDIEGAEIEVLWSVMKNLILPEQILVEFDIRRRPSINSFFTLKKIHNNILNKYDLIGINKKGDFTYIKKK